MSQRPQEVLFARRAGSAGSAGRAERGHPPRVTERRIDLRTLECFVALAEERHFGRAAARLGMAQPPLTQQIQKLERRLGCTVVQRRPRETVLTEAGRVLWDGAARLIRDADALIESARRAGRGESGRVTLGVPPSVMLAGVPLAVRRFREAMPHVEFVIREASTEDIVDGLVAGRLDIGLLREVAAVGGVPAPVVLREPVVAVLPELHRLASVRRLSLAQLASEPFILFPRRLGQGFHDRLTALCVEAGFVPRVVQEATQWQSVMTFVGTGLGVSIAPACIAKLGIAGVVCRPLPRLTTDVTMCAPSASTSPAVAAFAGVLSATLAARPPGMR